MESELETLKQATGSEELEKAELLAADKKAKAQVTYPPAPYLVGDKGLLSRFRLKT